MVPTRPYVVRAASAFPCTPRVRLPSASCDRCDGRPVGPPTHSAIRRLVAQE